MFTLITHPLINAQKKLNNELYQRYALNHFSSIKGDKKLHITRIKIIKNILLLLTNFFYINDINFIFYLLHFFV